MCCILFIAQQKGDGVSCVGGGFEKRRLVELIVKVVALKKATWWC